MSGPKTASYRFSAESRAAAIREAERRREERLKRLQAATERSNQLEQQSKQLKTLTDALRQAYPSETLVIEVPSLSRSSENDPDALEAYCRTAQDALDQASTKLSHFEKQAKSNKEFRSALRSAITAVKGGAMKIDDVVEAIPTSVPKTGEDELRARKERCKKILGRLKLTAGKVMPAELQALTSELISARTGGRSQALESELRLKVQQYNESIERRKRDESTARELLRKLDESGEDASSSSRKRLELAACGAHPLSTEVEAEAKRHIDLNASRASELQQKQAAAVVRKALGDLGYMVEPIEETLFVKGGTVHFQRAEWGEYFVRLRVRPDSREINFNVVRATSTDPDDPVNRKNRDEAAEIEWCGAFGKLTATLKARGLETNLTRELAVGAVPAQAVSPATIERVPRARATKRGDSATLQIQKKPVRQ